MSFVSVSYLVVLVVIVAIVSSAVRVMREYQRAVVFTLGRFTGVKGPGLILLIPYAQQMVRVDLRTVVLDVPSQDVISRDNVSVKVNAVLYFRVVDPDRAVIQVENFLQATSQLAQTTLRSVLGKHTLDEMLAERDKLNQDIQEILDAQTESWGVKVANVEIKQVDIGESMVRAIARQAEAERTRRAKIINAEGEQQAAQKLVEAAQILADQPRCHAAALPRRAERDRRRTQLDHRVPVPDRAPQGVRRDGRAGRGTREGRNRIRTRDATPVTSVMLQDRYPRRTPLARSGLGAEAVLAGRQSRPASLGQGRRCLTNQSRAGADACSKPAT